MMYEIRKRMPESTLLPAKGIFNIPHHKGKVWEELAFDDTKLYAVGKWIAAQLNVMVVTGFVPLSPVSPTECLNQLSYLPIPFQQQYPSMVHYLWDKSHQRNRCVYFALVFLMALIVYK